MANGSFAVEDDGNAIEVGPYTSVDGAAEFVAVEGRNIIIGEDCMFSGEIKFRTGDSHSILNLENERINLSADISHWRPLLDWDTSNLFKSNCTKE